MPYRDFYRMQAEAFGSLPVLNLFYSSRTHQDGWRYLLRGIAAREPFLFVAGDYGMGKTMLSMMLVRLLKKKDIPLVQITDPHCGFSGILRRTAVLLGLDPASLPGEEPLLTAIYERLGSRDSRQAILVIIDDAQELGIEALVRLRAFANFNCDGFFPLQLIFFAHPSFGSLLKDPRLAAMDQRIKRRHRLLQLTLQETKEYIYFRLVKSGAPGAPFFDDDAVREIHAATGGIPRLINNICDASLTRAASKLETCITLATVREARSDQAESFMPRVVSSARFPAIQNSEPFSAPPVHIIQPQQTDTESEPVQATAAPVRSRKPWLPVAACAGAAVAACLGVFFFLKFSAPAAPATAPVHQDVSLQAAAMPGAQHPEKPALPEADVTIVAVEQVAASEPSVPDVAAVSRAVPEPSGADLPIVAVEQVAASKPSVADVAVVSQAVPEPSGADVPAAVVEQVAASESSVADVSQAVPEPLVADVPDVAVSQAMVVSEQPGPEDLFGGAPSAPDEGRPFTLRLGCYKTAESASTAAATYARRKVVPFVAHVNLQQQGRWWIFYTGSFSSYQQAKQARESIGLTDADIIFLPYACRIGVFSSADIDAGLMSEMEKLGCVPYLLDNGDGTVSLFAGVYRRRDNAEILRKALADSSIESTVVLLQPATPSAPEAVSGSDRRVPAS